MNTVARRKRQSCCDASHLRSKIKPSLYLTNRFHVAVRLFSNRSQMTSKCGKNKKVAHKAQPSGSLMFFISNFASLTDTKIVLM